MAEKDSGNKKPDTSEGRAIPGAGNTAAVGETATATASPRTGYIPPSPPRFISVDELMTASNLVTNMMLAHEIAVDDEFRIEKPEPPAGSLERVVTDTMHKAFWDMLTEKLSQEPPDYNHALVLIQEVKEKLLSCLMPQHSRLREHINEVLDLELIKQKVANDAFDIQYYASFVQSLMSQLCAPARDADVAKLKDLHETVPLFKEMFRILDIMHLDMANAQIQQIRPYLKQQSINYEKKKFEDFLAQQQGCFESPEAGIDGLEYTRQWLERSYDILDESQGQSQELFNTSIKQCDLTPANVLYGSYLELLNWENEIFPESCLMDQQRFLEITYNLRKLTLVGSSLLVAFNYIGDRLSGHTQLRDRLKSEVLAILSDVPESQFRLKMANVADHITNEMNKELENHSYKRLDDESLVSFRNKVADVIDPQHVVYSLLWKRLMTFIFQSLGHSSSQPLQLPQGLGAVAGDMSPYVGKYLKLVAHNKAVFGIWYADIIGALMNVTDLSPRTPVI